MKLSCCSPQLLLLLSFFFCSEQSTILEYIRKKIKVDDTLAA